MSSTIQPHARPCCSLTVMLVGTFLTLGCSKGPVTAKTLTRAESGKLVSSPWMNLPAERTPRNVVFDGAIKLLDATVVPAAAKPGDTVTLTAHVLLLKDLLGDWQVFIHGGGAGGEMNVVQSDHAVLGGLLPVARWRPGEVLEDVTVLRIPDPCPVGQLQLWGGFFQGQARMRVDTAADHDGSNRVLWATVAVGNGAALPEYVAPHTQGAVVVDGLAQDKDWEHAPRVGPFFNYDGRGYPSNKTYARLLWNEEALFVYFEMEDKDIWTSYTKRDDPIYNEEAVEIFLDVDADLGTGPDPNTGTYQELQAAPNEVHFDASFTGRRRGMNTAFNHPYETKAVLQGTLNNPGDVDVGWQSEWRIPWAGLTDVKTGVKAGQRLRFNLFRLDKVRQAGRVVENQASAWSSPLSGDFHNTARFGWLVLGP